MSPTAPSRRQLLAAADAKRDRGERHYVPRQLNVYVLDVEDECTDFGRHNRLVGPFGDVEQPHIVTLREDLIGLPESTEEDRHRVLHGRLQIARGPFVYVSSEQWSNDYGESIEHTYHAPRRP